MLKKILTKKSADIGFFFTTKKHEVVITDTQKERQKKHSNNFEKRYKESFLENQARSPSNNSDVITVLVITYIIHADCSVYSRYSCIKPSP